MKTGKLITGAALAALTAACTNETMQFEPQAPETGNRPMVNVELSFDENTVEMGQGETRLEFDKVADKGYQWLFEDGDRIGALLMDTWNGLACGIDNFTLVDYVHTNYAFIRETGEDGKAKWVTPENAPVCEGNYFFYFPYNDNFAHRGHVAWDVNPVQKQYNCDGELWQMQSVKDNQKWIGYKFVTDKLEGKVNKVDFAFVPIFAMPTFDIVNMSGAELTVNKLVVRTTSNTQPEINPSGMHELMATTMALTPATRGFSSVNKGWDGKKFDQKVAEMWKHAQSYTYDSAEDEQYVWPVGPSSTSLSWNVNGKTIFPLNENHSEESIRQAPTYEYVADFSGVKGGYKVEAMDHIQAMLTMPGGLYAYGNDQTFEAYLYVTSKAGDDYVVRIDLGKAQTQGATNNSNYDDVVSGAANKFLKPGMYTKYKASFDATALQSYDISDFKVTSTDDLLWVLDEAEGDGIYDLCVTTSGSRVVLTREVEEKLNSKPYIRLHINGEITIAEDASENAINLLWFKNPHMNTTLNIVNKQVKKAEVIVNPATGESTESKVLGNCEINVKKSGELDTKTNGISIVAPVTNAGTVVAANITGDVNNSGTMTAGDIAGDVENTNTGDLTAGNITGNVKNNNNGTMKAGNITGNVENNGKMEAGKITGNLTNTGSVCKVNDVTGTVRNTGNASVANVGKTVENNGTIELRGATYAEAVNNNKDMTITGASTFKENLTNKGTCTVKANVSGEKSAINNGTINIADNVTFKFDEISNAKGATINVNEGAKLITNTNDDDKIINAGTINNNGTAHKVQNNGTINAGSKSYTAITSGEGTVDNSALGDVSYEGVTDQTVILKIDDITGISLSELDDKIQKADANKLIINKGTIDLGGEKTTIMGHTDDNVLKYFAKGVVLGDITVTSEPGGMLILATDGVTVNKSLFANTYSEVVFYKSSTEGTTLTLPGLLTTADHAIVRGGKSAQLAIKGEGEVHNSATIIANITEFTGTWTGNAVK